MPAPSTRRCSAPTRNKASTPRANDSRRCSTGSRSTPTWQSTRSTWETFPGCGSPHPRPRRDEYWSGSTAGGLHPGQCARTPQLGGGFVRRDRPHSAAPRLSPCTRTRLSRRSRRRRLGLGGRPGRRPRPNRGCHGRWRLGRRCTHSGLTHSPAGRRRYPPQSRRARLTASRSDRSCTKHGVQRRAGPPLSADRAFAPSWRSTCAAPTGNTPMPPCSTPTCTTFLRHWFKSAVPRYCSTTPSGLPTGSPTQE